MQKKMGQIRLYVSQPLQVNQSVSLDEAQSHYLSNVMKIKLGEEVFCFDGQSGEYKAQISQISKKQCLLNIKEQTKPYQVVPDIWLLFAPVKKDNTDFIIQKATELGVRKIIPLITRYTISERIKKERFVAQAIEAAEQCRRVDVPEISDVAKFADLWQTWDKTRQLYYMDETLKGKTVAKAFANAHTPCAILVGPEGGFSSDELEMLRKMPFTQGVKLGNRILRAETAVAAALSCWQALSGDWQ